MPDPDSNSPGFSRGRRWLTTLNLLAATLAVLAVLVMLNYVAQGHIKRYELAKYTDFKLSPQTLRVLHSLTNDVEVTIFYEHSDGDVYLMICGLLAEYQNACPHIHVQALDYVASPGKAIALRERLHLTRPGEKDFVAFESNGHSKICPGGELSNFNIDEILGGKSREARRTEFMGEAKFTDLIFAVSYPREMKAYFLRGHGERDPGVPGEKPGSDQNISKLGAILKDEIDCDWQTLLLTGTNAIPADCNLLIIAAKRGEGGKLTSNELAQIEIYLKHNNGRLLALLSRTEGLESILGSDWGVWLADGFVTDQDKNAQIGRSGLEFLASWAMTRDQPIHPIIKPLVLEGQRLEMVAPRPIFSVGPASKAPDAPTITPLAASSTNAVAVASTAKGVEMVYTNINQFTVLAAIEKTGVVSGRDGTRIVLAGDSEFLDDYVIDNAANHFFARLALNWLLDRPEIAIKGLGPRPIKEYKIVMTEAQTRQMEWLFLGVMPGTVLALGGLVWLRRRS